MKSLESVLNKIITFRGHNSDKALFAIACIIIISLASDLLISYMYLGGVDLSPSWAVATYGVLSAVFVIAQYLLLGFVETTNKELGILQS